MLRGSIVVVIIVIVIEVVLFVTGDSIVKIRLGILLGLLFLITCTYNVLRRRIKCWERTVQNETM